MEAILTLFTKQSLPGTLMLICLTAGVGVLISKIKILNVRLGIAGVLFSGLAFAHFGVQLDEEILHFVRELGLLMFVFSIGLEIGPRFISSMKINGLKLNMLAALIVVLGIGIAIFCRYAFNLDPAAAVGLLCGSVTNTPSLGAAQQLYTSIFGKAGGNVMGMSYAIAYPFGILGIILSMLIIRVIFRISVDQSQNDYNANLNSTNKAIESVKVKVTNENIIGKSIADINKLSDDKLVISRIKRNEEFIAATDNFVINSDDMLYGAAESTDFEAVNLLIGAVEINTIEPIEGSLSMKEVIVTNRRIAGKTVSEIGIYRRYPANIMRIFRGDFEYLPNLNSTVEFGDTIRIVGKKAVLDDVAKEFGNSMKDLEHPNVLPIFIGVVLGIIFGSIPIYVPGLSVPAKLGLAGGPLVIAILFGNIGRIGKFDFYVTRSANLMLREIGIIMFLGAVGLLSGHGFIDSIWNGGYWWILYGAAITFIPLMLVGVIAHFLKLNYLSIVGLLAGSMTDPPALEFANSIAPCSAQSIAYATVYPLVMLLRIFTAQLMLLMII